MLRLSINKNLCIDNKIHESIQVNLSFIIYKEFKNIYILYVYTHARAHVRERERKPIIGKQDRGTCSESRIFWAMPAARVAISWTSRVPEQRVNSATSGLVPFYILPGDVYSIKTSATFGRVLTSRMLCTQFPSGDPRSLWWGWHVQDCASRRERRKEGCRMGWEDFTQAWKDARVSRQDVIKHVARRLNSIGRTSAYCTQTCASYLCKMLIARDTETWRI